MNNSALISTFSLTVLLMIGLFFFIRGSVKDRTEQIELEIKQSEEAILPKLQAYFDDRQYRLLSVEGNLVKFEGFVPPSVFLAVFLSFLAGLGLFSLALVLSFLFPDYAQFTLSLTLLSPLAGVFYWQNGGKTEQVLLKIEPLNPEQTKITVRGHRDELIVLEQTFKINPT